VAVVIRYFDSATATRKESEKNKKNQNQNNHDKTINDKIRSTVSIAVHLPPTRFCDALATGARTAAASLAAG
jgi:hypothetical protein